MKKVLFFGLLIGSLGIALFVLGCSQFEELPTTTTTTTTLPRTAAPVFVTAPGTYETSGHIVVTIEAEDGAEIYYTDDGSTPVEVGILQATGSQYYTAPITLSSSKLIKAIAVKAGSSESEVASASYDLYWWQALGSSADDDIYALAYDPENGILYAGGTFTAIGGVSDVHHVAQWNGSAWSAMDGGVENTVEVEVDTLLYANGALYAGGDFLTAGSATVRGITKWDGSSWSPLGSGVSGGFDVVFTLAFDSSSNDLIAGGDYTSPASHLARWDGSAWSAFSTQPNNRVSNLAYDPANNRLYASGWFNNIGTNNLAQWNGSAWSGLGTGIYHTDFPADLLALAADSGSLYVGGKFNRAGSETVSNIAFWDGSAWSAVDSGVNDSVYALAYDSASGKLYVGGAFTTAGGSPANYIARWNGSAWSTLGTGLDGAVENLLVDPDGNVYACGYFTTAGGLSAARIAKWGRK